MEKILFAIIDDMAENLINELYGKSNKIISMRIRTRLEMFKKSVQRSDSPFKAYLEEIEENIKLFI